MKFKRIPAKTVVKLRNSGLTIPLPMVIATAVPVAAPRKLQIVAIIMALRGDSVRVPITVAIALAASLKPFAMPKPIAIINTIINNARGSGML